MGEMASIWGYAEHGEMDQLGQKLLYTSLELEKLKSEYMEEKCRNKEYVSQLIQLLKCAIEERDEVKKQLDKMIAAAGGGEIYPYFQGGGDSPLIKPAKAANSSVTESNSLSDTHNYPSPVDSFFDAAVVSSPLLNFAADRGSVVIDNLCKGRALPLKGSLLQAVLQAGPLLQTLMVAGPLPRWRNPPQMQLFQIPPVAIKGGEAEGNFAAKQMMSNLTSNAYNVPIVSNFGDDVNYEMSALISPAAVSSNGCGCFRLPKRQRFC